MKSVRKEGTMPEEKNNVYAIFIDIDEKTQRNFIDEMFPQATGEKVEVRVRFKNNKNKVTVKDFFLGEFLEKLGFFPM